MIGHLLWWKHPCTQIETPVTVSANSHFQLDYPRRSDDHSIPSTVTTGLTGFTSRLQCYCHGEGNESLVELHTIFLQTQAVSIFSLVCFIIRQIQTWYIVIQFYSRLRHHVFFLWISFSNFLIVYILALFSKQTLILFNFSADITEKSAHFCSFVRRFI